MTSDYWVGSWRLPKERKADAENYLQVHDLSLFSVDEVDGKTWLNQNDGEVCSETVDRIDGLLEAVAGWVRATELDGQANNYSYDSDTGYKVICDGVVYDVPLETLFISKGVGKLTGPTFVSLTGKIIALPGDKTDDRELEAVITDIHLSKVRSEVEIRQLMNRIDLLLKNREGIDSLVKEFSALEGAYMMAEYVLGERQAKLEGGDPFA